MSVKQHLIEMHTQAGEHAVAHGTFHKTMSRHFSKLAECAKATKSELKNGQEDPATIAAAISAEHASMAEECADQAAYHVQCCKDLSASMKAAGVDDDLSAMRPLPEGLSVIHGDMPVNKLVLRLGMREPERPNVPREFEKLVSVNDEAE
jgi:hypothetical protein